MSNKTIAISIITSASIIAAAIYYAPMALYDHKMKDCIMWIEGDEYDYKTTGIDPITKKNCLDKINN